MKLESKYGYDKFNKSEKFEGTTEEYAKAKRTETEEAITLTGGLGAIFLMVFGGIKLICHVFSNDKDTI